MNKVSKWWRSFLIGLSIKRAVVNGQQCWKDAYYRGVGLAPYILGSSCDLINGICYAPCISGYQQKVSDNTYCESICPTVWVENGPTCSARDTYVKSTAYLSDFDCLNSNDQYLTPRGCEIYSSSHYPVCDYGYSVLFGYICVYTNVCPSPLTGGTSPCTKHLYLRSSTSSICPSGLVIGTDNLCYTPCLNGYDGDHICRDQSCPSSSPTSCSNMFCTSSTGCGSTQSGQASTMISFIDSFIAAPNLQFNVKDIVQANGLSSVAPNICGQNNFQDIDDSMNNLHSCKARRYPMFLGSSAGDTVISIFELDFQGNIGFGGKSSDTSLVSVSSNPIVGHLYQIGFNYTWIYEFNIPSSEVQAIAFSSDNTKMIAIFNSPNVDIVSFLVEDGSILSKNQFSPVILQPTIAIKVDPVSSMVIFSGIDLSSNLILGVLNIFDTSSITSSNYVSILKLMIPTSIQIRELPSTIFVATNSQLPQTPPSSTISQCLGISEFSYSSSPVSLSYVSTFYSNLNYPKGIIKFKDFGGGSNGLNICSNGVAPTTFGIMITRNIIVPSSLDSIIYQESITDDIRCLDFTVISSTQTILMTFNSVRYYTKIVTIDYVGGGNYQLTEKLLTKPTLTSTDLLWGRVMSSSDFYLSGKINKYYSCMNVGSSTIGFILNSLQTRACDILISSQSAPILKALSPSVTFQSFVFPASTGPVSLSFSSISQSQIPQNKMYKTINLCCNQNIVTYPMNNQRYIIDYPEETYIYPDFYFSPVVCNDIFRYWYKIDSVPPIPQLPSPVIYFDWLHPKFKVYTSNPIAAGTYTITVTGKLPNHQTQAASTFQIELFNIPPAIFITPTYIPDLTFIVGSKQLTHEWQDFISRDPTYYLIYYLELQDKAQNTWIRNLEIDLFNFEQGGKKSLIQVHTVENSKVGVYNIRIVGKFTPNTHFQATSYFKAIITHQCRNTLLVPSNMKSLYVFQMDFPPSMPKIIKFKQWKETLGICQPFVYKAFLSDDTKMPNFINFQSTLRQFKIEQTDEMKAGTYMIKLVGKLDKYFLKSSIQFKINIECQSNLIYPAQPNDRINYILGQPPYRVQIQEFKQIPDCGNDLQYHATLNNGDILPKDYLSFYIGPSQIGRSRDLIVSFQAKQLPLQEQFIVQIIPFLEIKSPRNVVLTPLILTFNIRQLDQFIVREYPPIFIVLKSGTEKNLPFGSSQLDQTIETQFKKFQIIFTENSYSQTKLIITSNIDSTYNSDISQIIISGKTEDNVDFSNYIIESEISDKGRTKFRIVQKIAVHVYKNDEQLNEEKEIFKLKGLLKLAYSLNNSENNSDFQGQISINQTTKLKARIENVNEKGIATLRFNMQLQRIKNLSYIDQEVLQLDIVSSKTDQSRNLNMTWHAINMTEREIKIQMNFSEPKSVSIFTTRDTLKLVFKEWAEIIFQPVENMIKPTFFISSDASKLKLQKFIDVIEYQELTFPMPLILPYSFIQNKISAAYSAISILISASIAANFFLAATLQISMSQILGIIEFLQIITHMPFLFPNLPSNYQYIIQLIYDVARFEIIPEKYTAYILKLIEQHLKISIQPNYQVTIMLYLIFSFIMLILIQLTRLLRFKYQKFQNKIEDLKYKIMFGAFISSIKEAYLPTLFQMFCLITIGGGPQFFSTSTIESEDSSNLSPNFKQWIPFSIIIVLSLAPIAILFFLLANYDNLEIQPFNMIWNMLYQNLDTKNSSRYLFNVLFLLRRLIYVLSIHDLLFSLILSETYLQNAFLTCITSFLLILYISYFAPFQNKANNYREILNEVTIWLLFLIPMCALLVDESILDGAQRHLVGYVLIGILQLNILINYLIFLVNLIKELWQKLKIFWNFCKQQRKRNTRKTPIVHLREKPKFELDDSIIKREENNISRTIKKSHSTTRGIIDSSFMSGQCDQDQMGAEKLESIQENLNEDEEEKMPSDNIRGSQIIEEVPTQQIRNFQNNQNPQQKQNKAKKKKNINKKRSKKDKLNRE